MVQDERGYRTFLRLQFESELIFWTTTNERVYSGNACFAQAAAFRGFAHYEGKFIRKAASLDRFLANRRHVSGLLDSIYLANRSG